MFRWAPLPQFLGPSKIRILINYPQIATYQMKLWLIYIQLAINLSLIVSNNKKKNLQKNYEARAFATIELCEHSTQQPTFSPFFSLHVQNYCTTNLTSILPFKSRLSSTKLKLGTNERIRCRTISFIVLLGILRKHIR